MMLSVSMTPDTLTLSDSHHQIQLHYRRDHVLFAGSNQKIGLDRLDHVIKRCQKFFYGLYPQHKQDIYEQATELLQSHYYTWLPNDSHLIHDLQMALNRCTSDELQLYISIPEIVLNCLTTRRNILKFPAAAYAYREWLKEKIYDENWVYYYDNEQLPISKDKIEQLKSIQQPLKSYFLENMRYTPSHGQASDLPIRLQLLSEYISHNNSIPSDNSFWENGIPWLIWNSPVAELNHAVQSIHNHFNRSNYNSVENDYRLLLYMLSETVPIGQDSISLLTEQQLSRSDWSTPNEQLLNQLEPLQSVFATQPLFSSSTAELEEVRSLTELIRLSLSYRIDGILMNRRGMGGWTERHIFHCHYKGDHSLFMIDVDHSRVIAGMTTYTPWDIDNYARRRGRRLLKQQLDHSSLHLVFDR